MAKKIETKKKVKLKSGPKPVIIPTIKNDNIVPGNLIDPIFSEDEMKVMYLFVDGGGRMSSYNKVFKGKDKLSQSGIYRWFQKPAVEAKIAEIGQTLCIYDTFCDKTLLNMIKHKDTSNRDKINAIKVWNDLRQRVHTNIKISVEDRIDFSNVTDDNLESIVEAIMRKDEAKSKNTSN